MSSILACMLAVWGMALVLAAPLLAAVYVDSRRGLLDEGSTARDEDLIF